MESKDTVGNIAPGNIATNDMMLLIIVLIVFVAAFLYILFKPKKLNVEEDNSTSTPSVKRGNITTIDKEIKVDLPEETSKNESKGTTATTVNLSKYAIKQESIETKDVVETEQPNVPTIRVTETVAETPPLIILPQEEEEEEEEQTKEKYIGYNPINLFAQTEPLHFPYVIMPKPKCVIKFPRKGKMGRKGFKEEAFKKNIEEYFRNSHQVYDDRFVLVQNSSKPYEPDFALINESNGINIFLDIEIDEPYEGTNDILNRKPTHYQYADTNRNNAFKNRGWIVIRFAEIQVHQKPDVCCKFIADVIKSIDSSYKLPEKLQSINTIQSIPQWTEEQAKQWSSQKYREHYLGIERFGITSNDGVLVDIEETELGKSIEEKVVDNKTEDILPYEKKVDNYTKVYTALFTNKYLSLTIRNKKTIVKPIRTTEKEVVAFCYVKNQEQIFSIIELENIEIKDNYYTIRVAGPTIGLDKISNIVNTAIDYKKLIRMKYTRASWNSMLVDTETGELIIDKIEAEESVRTVNDVQLSINSLSEEHIQSYRLNSNYLTAYCNKREEQRTFRFDRIGEIEILNI
jgi:hypothetical protein